MRAQDIDYIVLSKSDATANDDVKQIIFEDAFMAARECYGRLTAYHCQTMTYSELYFRFNRYIKTKANFTNRPAGFIPSVIWWWIAKAVISWIINRIIDHIMKHDRE